MPKIESGKFRADSLLNYEYLETTYYTQTVINNIINGKVLWELIESSGTEFAKIGENVQYYVDFKATEDDVGGTILYNAACGGSSVRKTNAEWSCFTGLSMCWNADFITNKFLYKIKCKFIATADEQYTRVLVWIGGKGYGLMITYDSGDNKLHITDVKSGKELGTVAGTTWIYYVTLTATNYDISGYGNLESTGASSYHGVYIYDPLQHTYIDWYYESSELLSYLQSKTAYDISVQDKNLMNVADPIRDQDAVTKAFLERLYYSKAYYEENKYTDAEAVTAMGAKADANPLHHDRTVKYTDAEARTAIGDLLDSVGKLLKDLECENHSLKNVASIDGGGNAVEFHDTFLVKKAGVSFELENTGTGENKFYFAIGNTTGHVFLYNGDDTKNWYIQNAARDTIMSFLSLSAAPFTISLPTANLDMSDNIIKDPKNHVASALSGTKKLVEIEIDGSPYYFEVSPTKA